MCPSDSGSHRLRLVSSISRNSTSMLLFVFVSGLSETEPVSGEALPECSVLRRTRCLSQLVAFLGAFSELCGIPHRHASHASSTFELLLVDKASK
jgi:hypothetical protein